MTKDSVSEHDRELLQRSLEARARLSLEIVSAVGAGGSAGDYFDSYACSIKNRIIDLFDDCLLLLNANRTPSACVLARCIIETLSVGAYACAEVDVALKEGGVLAARDRIVAFINSSRLKVEEQERVKKGKFALDDYAFTAAARERMEQELASSVHVSKALRYFYRAEMEASGRTESSTELYYSFLCEWTHPSQTSLFHAYARGAQLVPTSVGLVSVRDGARMACIQAMALIIVLEHHFAHMREAAQYLRSLETLDRLSHLHVAAQCVG